MNYSHNRNLALIHTHGPTAAYMLNTCFPDLVAVQDEEEPEYRDISFTGIATPTWKEVELLHLLVKHAKPLHVLDIGTGIGWAAAHMAKALPEKGELMCVDPFTQNGRGLGEPNVDIYVRLQDNLERAQVMDKCAISAHESPAILAEIAPEGGWDLVFLDGWQEDGQPRKDLEGVLEHINPKTVIVMHDFRNPNVHAAATYLAKQKTDKDVQQWYFTGFVTRCDISIFVQGVYQEKGEHKYPKWWDKFHADIDTVFAST